MSWYDEFDENALAKQNPTFTRAVDNDDMMKLAEVLKVDAVRITYTVGGTEPLHPDPEIASRMREIGINNYCGYGCKVYADPKSNVRVLAHNRSYGCPK